MIVWDILNSLARVAIAVLLAVHLWRYGKDLIWLERYGLGLAAGTSLLTVTVIWEGTRSPYDGWATTLFSVGILMYLKGRDMRLAIHALRNRLQLAQGRLR